MHTKLNAMKKGTTDAELKGSISKLEKETPKVSKINLKKEPKAELEKANKDVITQKVIVNRVLKYKYPKGCIDTLARKTFRQKTRNAIRKMGREIEKLKGEERKVLKEKLAAFLETNCAIIA